MAGMQFTTKEVSEDAPEVSQNRDFRRRFVGDHAELMNNLCEAVQHNFGLKGSQPQHVILDALFRAAMRLGSLEFKVNGELKVLDVSEATYGNVLGLLNETRSWDTSKQGAKTASAPVPVQQPSPAQTENESPAGKQNLSLLPELTPAEQQLLNQQAAAEMAPNELVDSSADIATDGQSLSNDSENQLPMQLDEEAEVPAPEATVNTEDQAIAKAEPASHPVRNKPVKPDFNAAMTGKKNS